MPPRLKKLGYANIVVGPLVALINVAIIGKSASRLASLDAPGAIVVPLVCIAVVFFALGAVLFLGGIGLVKERPWGRAWSLAFAFGSFAAVLLVSVTARTLTNLSEIGEVSIPGLHQRENFNVGIGIFTLYGILLIVFLMLADARTWAHGEVATAGTPSTGTINQASASPTSGLAIASFVASLIPFLFLGQITGLVLGIIALRKIKQSNETIGGKGFAIAGIAISSLILLFVLGLLVLVILTGAFRK
jgi:hypothetical protein